MGTTSSKLTRHVTKQMIITFGQILTQDERFSYFRKLTDDLQKEMWGYLNLQDKSNLARTSTEYKRLLSNDLMTAKVLMLVAQGQQTQAHALLVHQSNLLSQRGDVTDYSGRTFKNITAYEYAYWAKDWHMCRMLEAHMDEETKALTLASCEKMERDGLTYTQNGVEFGGSKHFDFIPLIDAYANYIQIYDRWCARNATSAEVDAAWFAIGVMQRDVPAYVAQEYCRPDRSFSPRPVFNELNLPRTLTFDNIHNHRISRDEQWFPLVISGTSGLGVNFALVRGRAGGARGALAVGRGARVHLDLRAVTSLDQASANELTRSRENLKPLAHGLEGPGL
jgi:hypothetical protein